MRRRLGVIVALGALLCVLGGVVTASPAVAGRGPKWESLPARPFTVPTSFCGFKIGVTFPVDKEYAKLLKAADGSMITLVTGSLRFTFTNVSTGKAVTENESGPGKVTTHADGSVSVREQGHTPIILVPADAKRFGLPTVGVTTGALTFSVAADGSITSVSLRGHVLVNVCAALS